MAALDPFDMLVRLGKISQANLQAADLVELGVGTSTRAARLVAIGVDKGKLLKDLSELTRMPVASAEVLASLGPMKLPASYSRAMKELLAVPIGRVDDDIIDVAIADPRTTTKLRDAAIAHRPHLALEADVLAALQRVFPENDVLDPIAEPTLKNVPLAPRPVSVNDGDAALAESTADDAPRGEGEPQRDATGLQQQETQSLDDAQAIHDVELPDQEPPSTLEAVQASNAAATPSRERPASPFAKTTVHSEVTERVRERHREAHEQSATAAAPPLESPLQSRLRLFQERARAVFALVRERGAQADVRTHAIAAVIGVAVVVALVALIAFAASDGGDDAPIAVVGDAGVVTPVVDAGDAGDAGDTSATQLSTTPTPPVIEKPQKPKKQKRKPSRTKRKPPR